MFRPKGIGRDSEGHLYMVEGLSGTVQVFDRDGQLLYYFGQKGSGFGEFQLPTGLFIDHNDRVLVVDSYHRRVQVFQYFALGKHIMATIAHRTATAFSLRPWCLCGLVAVCLGFGPAAMAQRCHRLARPVAGGRLADQGHAFRLVPVLPCAALRLEWHRRRGADSAVEPKLSSVQSYTVYTSSTMVNTANPSPALGTDSTLCLSCHDGTVAGSPGALVAYGQVPLSGQMNSADVFGTNLTTMHPVSFTLPLKSSPDLVPSLTANPPSTADQTGAVRLINGNVECTSCHNPHVQNTDPNNPNFLVIDNSSSALCLACHSTIPTGTGMGLSNVLVASHNAMSAAGSPLTASAAASNTNPLAGWGPGIHATAANRVAPQISIASNAAVSNRSGSGRQAAIAGLLRYGRQERLLFLPRAHNAPGQNSLLRGVDDQACLVCHNGSSNISPPIANVLAEMVAPKFGHAFSAGNTPHRAHEAALLNQNIHVTCVDCHNPHATNRVTNFPSAPAIRPSQSMVTGDQRYGRGNRRSVRQPINMRTVCAATAPARGRRRSSISAIYPCGWFLPATR